MKTFAILYHLIFFSSILAAQQPLTYPVSYSFEGVNDFQERYNDLYTYTQILVDPTGEWSYKEVLKKDNLFKKNTTRTDNDRGKVYWVKLYLKAKNEGKYLFSVGKLYFGHGLVDLYYERDDSLYHQISGFKRRPAERTIRRSGSYFWIDLPSDTIQTIYIRIDNHIYPQNWPGKRNPISIFHIDSTSPSSLTGVFWLWDLASAPPPEEVFTNRKFRQAALPYEVQLGHHFEFYPDPSCQLILEDVRKDWDLKSYFRGYMAHDFDLTSCHWARLVVVNPKPFSQTRTFAYSSAKWDQIDYYLPGTDGHYDKYHSFPNQQNQEAFSFSIAARDTLILYIKYPPRANGYPGPGSMVDIHPEVLKSQQQLIRYKYLLAGVVIFFTLYFFLQLVFNRELLLFSYFLVVLGLAPILLTSLDSINLFRYTQIIYNLPPAWHWLLFNIGEVLAYLGSLLFMTLILNLKDHFPLLVKLVKYLILFTILLGLLRIVSGIWYWNDRNELSISLRIFSENIQSGFGGLLGIFILFTGLKAYFSRIPLSGNFLIVLLPLTLFSLFDGIIQPLIFPDWPTNEIFIIGVLLSLTLYGILVGARINLMRQDEHEAAQQKMELQNQVLQIESKALRAQMNPHFIFNCLNSIKSLIQEAEHKKAIHYLTLFASFIRNVLHYSEEKQISLDQEIEISRLYLEMEKLRFENSFTYQIESDPSIDTSFIRVPPMILQPFLENAIWHGLMHKTGKRLLKLEVRAEGEFVKCVVDDNGVGRKQAAILQTNTHTGHRSFGTKLIQDRLGINKEMFDHHFEVNIIDKMANGVAAGTRVEISLGI